MNHKKADSKNLNLAVIFIAVVLFFILLSVVFKIFFLFKESKFDASNKFNLEIIDQKQTQIVSFSPQENSISILTLGKKINGDLSKNLEIPIDGIIQFKDYEFNKSNISTGLLHSLTFGNTLYKMTSLDVLRLVLFARKVNSGSVYTRNLNSDYTGTQRYNVLYLTFKDPVIFTQNQTIEIVNSTDVFGLGNRLATFISAMGGNVIFVKSDNASDKSKILYNDKKTYTIKRIEKAIGIPAEESKERGVADVIIIVGKDSLKDLNF